MQIAFFINKIHMILFIYQNLQLSYSLAVLIYNFHMEFIYSNIIAGPKQTKQIVLNMLIISAYNKLI